MKRLFLLFFICTIFSGCSDPCIDKECGTSEGVRCGSCDDASRPYCDSSQKCIAVCTDFECGYHHGSDCGDCDEGLVCDHKFLNGLDGPNQCYDPCFDKECGESEGVFCGTCSGEKEYCSNAYKCETACIDMVCGTDYDVVCGTCKTHWVCNLLYECELHYLVESSGGDVTVTDSTTDLIWTQEYFTNKNWHEAISYCDDLSYAGKSDWRLPDLDELKSLLDPEQEDYASDFPDMPQYLFWSSTAYAGDTDYAWFVVFSGGPVNMRVGNKTETISNVRCVR
jgi:hypothetical protein